MVLTTDSMLFQSWHLWNGNKTWLTDCWVDQVRYWVCELCRSGSCAVVGSWTLSDTQGRAVLKNESKQLIRGYHLSLDTTVSTGPCTLYWQLLIWWRESFLSVAQPFWSPLLPKGLKPLFDSYRNVDKVHLPTSEFVPTQMVMPQSCLSPTVLHSF